MTKAKLFKLVQELRKVKALIIKSISSLSHTSSAGRRRFNESVMFLDT